MGRVCDQGEAQSALNTKEVSRNGSKTRPMEYALLQASSANRDHPTWTAHPVADKWIRDPRQASRPTERKAQQQAVGRSVSLLPLKYA